MLPAFVFEARPVIPIDDAVRVELEAIGFRDGLNASDIQFCNGRFTPGADKLGGG